MKYLSYIFEDQDVRNQVEQHEVLVEMAAKAVIKHNILLESYIYNNMEQFTSSVDLNETYSSIRDFVISENTSLYSQISEVLADSQLSLEEKAYCLEVEEIDPNAHVDLLGKAAKGVDAGTDWIKEKVNKLAEKGANFANKYAQPNLLIAGGAAGALGYGGYKAYQNHKNRSSIG